MKCPRCGVPFNDATPRCPGCDFNMDDLERRVGRRVPTREGWFSDLGGAFELHEARALNVLVGERNRNLPLGEILVATVRSSAPARPSELVFWLFNRWEVGGPHHEGILVLFCMEERRVESEVGFGWEELVTDEASAEILDENVVPLLKKGKLREAIEATVDSLAGVVLARMAEMKRKPAAPASETAAAGEK